MAAVEVTITGLLYDKINRTTQNVVLIGEATLTGVGVGGGPIIPPEQPGKPPGIWGGGNVPMPTPPIANVPGAPGYRPPGTGIWPNPPEGQAPIPEHPIVLPPEGETPPPIDPSTPPITWKPVWTPSDGWVVVGIPNVPHPSPS